MLRTPQVVYQACFKCATGGEISIILCVYYIYDFQFHPHSFSCTRNIGFLHCPEYQVGIPSEDLEISASVTVSNLPYHTLWYPVVDINVHTVCF